MIPLPHLSSDDLIFIKEGPLKKGLKLNPVAAVAVEDFFDEAGAKTDRVIYNACSYHIHININHAF